MSRNRKQFFPKYTNGVFRRIRRELSFIKTAWTHKKQLKHVRKKETIRVAFLLINESIWKYSRVYFLLKEHPRFNPVVFICPFDRYGPEIRNSEMENAYHRMTKKGYHVIKTQQTDGSLMDIKKEFNPGIVFFCTPWKHTHQQYTIANFRDRLTCYTHYGYSNGNLYESDYNMATQNYAWKFFLESEYHLTLAKKYAARKGRNAVVTGYPGTDDFLDPKLAETSVWKPQVNFKKRIIWAPHHTIPGNISEKNYLNYGTFLEYAEVMIQLTQKYRDILFAFKPHPNLKGKLNEHWGEEKTAEYYQQWNRLPNTRLEEGDYVDLFLESDALIHDCGSFLIEYFFVNKPALYLVKTDDFKQEYNDLGKTAFDYLEIGKNAGDISRFIEQTVLGGQDVFKEKRKVFFESRLRPPNNRPASENIVDHLLNELHIHHA